MRCLALAQAWARRRGEAVFFLSETVPALIQRVQAEGFAVVTLPESCADGVGAVVKSEHCESAAWVVLDGYSFRARDQQDFLDAGLRVCVIDDGGQAQGYPAQLVLNQNAYATEAMYGERGRHTQLLLGPQFALLRREFLPWMSWERQVPSVARKVLITLGGSDAAIRSLDVLRAIASGSDLDLEVLLLVGGASAQSDRLAAEAGRMRPRVRVLQNSAEMPRLMAWADLAIAGAGVTSYELCFMGLPALLLVLADNQCAVADRLSEMGVARCQDARTRFQPEYLAEELRSLTATEARAGMAQRSRELIDGLGAERTCAAMLGKQLSLRLVRQEDCQLLFHWANDPLVRGASFHPGPISFEQHERWFATRLSDSASVIYIGEDARRKAVGQVRYQLQGDRATLSINLDPAVRGQGWGAELLYFSVRALFRSRGVRVIDAFVRPENKTSLRLFERAGFRALGTREVQATTAAHFVFEAEQPEAGHIPG
jgi:UDP-2,4-diacetamido-2,4,6-trideoxy-beta-L-altropyranose hydrolase